MIDLEQQKTAGIRSAKKVIADIYKKKKSDPTYKLTQDDRQAVAQAQQAIDRWQRVTKRGWKL